MEISSAVDRLVSAVRRVSDGWIPIQEGVFNHLEQRFTAGAYSVSRAALSKDLRMDPSLYLYCVRELGKRHSGVGHAPSELFFNTSLEDIYDVLHRAREQLSEHSYTDMTPFQAARLRETFISAITSERLASAVTLDPELGFTCGLLRQLGMTLTAWNFPDEYQEALDARKRDKETSIHDRLNGILGFAPSALCSTMIRQWNLSREIVDTVSARAKPGPDPFKSNSLRKHESPSAKLTKICNVAEMLAHAAQPEQYPNVLEELESAEKIIGQHLGSKAIDQIFNEARSRLMNCNPYELRMPDFPDVRTVKDNIVKSVHQKRLVEENKHLKHLPKTLQQHVHKLYTMLHPERIQKGALRYLIQGIIPAAGFERGCVYLYQPNGKRLAPSVTIGDVSDLQLRPIPVQSSFAQYDLIVSAYSIKSPLRSERSGASGMPTTALAAAIGDTAPVGVLYLETKPELSAQIDPDPVMIFRAVLRVLADCLNAK